MTLPRWREEPISKEHDRKAFDCGDRELNLFLQRYARQSHDAGGAKTFLAIDEADGRTIHGFYSVAPGSMSYARAPEILRHGLGQHDVPGFVLARLATSQALQGRGLGGQLLAAAARRCIRAAEQVGGVILIIDVKNERVARWYESYGGIALNDVPRTLVMSLASFADRLRAAA